MIPEQRHPARFDRRQVLLPVPNDEDRDPGHLLRPRAGGSESATDVGKRLAGLDRHITSTDQLALTIFGDLAGDENEPASRRGDDMCVRQGAWLGPQD